MVPCGILEDMHAENRKEKIARGARSCEPIARSTLSVLGNLARRHVAPVWLLVVFIFHSLPGAATKRDCIGKISVFYGNKV